MPDNALGSSARRRDLSPHLVHRCPRGERAAARACCRSSVLPLERAVRSMTGASADRLGLVERGYVRAGPWWTWCCSIQSGSAGGGHRHAACRCPGRRIGGGDGSASGLAPGLRLNGVVTYQDEVYSAAATDADLEAANEVACRAMVDVADVDSRARARMSGRLRRKHGYGSLRCEGRRDNGDPARHLRLQRSPRRWHTAHRHGIRSRSGSSPP
jgi:hypothetical protein